MIRIIKIYILFLFIASIQAQLTVAVADFKNNSAELYLDNWERMIPDYLKTELAASQKIILVERQDLETVLKEQALGMTGLIDSSTAQRVGVLLGAQLVITGTVSRTGGFYRIDAKMIRVSTGQVFSEKVRAKDDQHLNEMIELLANNIIYNLTRGKGYREKIELKKYPTKYFLLATIALGGGTFITHNIYNTQYDLYLKATTLPDIAAKYDKSNNYYKTRNILAVCTGAVLCATLYCWIKNISPDIIYACDDRHKKTIIPAIVLHSNSEVRIGVAVHF
jgi:TolB-like protein